MEKIIVYNPSITTLNVGDNVIYDSIEGILKPLFQDNFVVQVSTHLPVSSTFANLLKDADLKVVCGTNLLRNMLERRFKQWHINLFNAKKLGPVVLIGVGWQKDKMPFTPYTKMVYKTILSKTALHSVRDEYTKQMLEKMGFKNVINTGCPTIWSLTREKCASIPKSKQNNVVFTLTDYNRNKSVDKMIVDVLAQNYKKVYLWLQGVDDLDYARELGILESVITISPSLEAYDQILSSVDDLEYIGTRLHGGIRALQHGKRTMILAVDNRAIEKKKDFNIPVVERDKLTIDSLTELICSQRKTDIVIPEENIKKWKSQFGL